MPLLTQDIRDIIVNSLPAARRQPRLEFLSGNVYVLKTPPAGLTSAQMVK